MPELHGATSILAADTHERSGSVSVGLILAGRRSGELLHGIGHELGSALKRTYPEVRWAATAVQQHLGLSTGEVSELTERARQRLLAEGWDLVLLVTDLPIQAGRRPVISHASPTHAAGVISLPALGPVQPHRRLINALVDIVGVLIGDETSSRASSITRSAPRRRRATRPLAFLEAQASDTPAGAFFAARAIATHVRWLTGIVATNRPWRLAARLYRALVAALAFIMFSITATGIWQLAATIGTPRLAVVSIGSILIMVSSLIAVHDLWERADSPSAREQVVLFNAATTLTLIVGVATLYLALTLATLLVAWLLIPSHVLGGAVHHAAGAGDYLRLAWLVSSLATVGGALGAAVESDAEVREATYASRMTSPEVIHALGQPQEELSPPAPSEDQPACNERRSRQATARGAADRRPDSRHRPASARPRTRDGGDQPAAADSAPDPSDRPARRRIRNGH